MKIADIRLTQEFYSDYDHAPQQVKRSMDKLIRMMTTNGDYPRSMKKKKIKSDYNDVFSGYVTRNHRHWRVLFEEDLDGTIVLLRLLDHEKRDKYLNEFI